MLSGCFGRLDLKVVSFRSLQILSSTHILKGLSDNCFVSRRPNLPTLILAYVLISLIAKPILLLQKVLVRPRKHEINAGRRKDANDDSQIDNLCLERGIGEVQVLNGLLDRGDTVCCWSNGLLELTKLTSSGLQHEV